MKEKKLKKGWKVVYERMVDFGEEYTTMIINPRIRFIYIPGMTYTRRKTYGPYAVFTNKKDAKTWSLNFGRRHDTRVKILKVEYTKSDTQYYYAPHQNKKFANLTPGKDFADTFKIISPTEEA